MGCSVLYGVLVDDDQSIYQSCICVAGQNKWSFKNSFLGSPYVSVYKAFMSSPSEKSMVWCI